MGKKVTGLLPEWVNSSGQDIDLDNQEGFIYCITNKVTGQKYIGRKYFWKRLRKKIPGKVRRRRVKEESDWQSYWGSCVPLHDDIKLLGIENFKRELLSIHTCRRDVIYEEVAAQFAADVLRAKDPEGNYCYYNSNILTKFFRKIDSLEEKDYE